MSRRFQTACAVAGVVLLSLTLRATAQQAATPDLTEVRIATIPAGANVFVNDELLPDPAPLAVRLPPGRHILRAVKDGFRDARQGITVERGRVSAVELRLDRLLALALIQSSPPGADVEIGGAARGQTPLLLTDLQPGTHRVRLSTPGHAPKELDLVLNGRTPVRLAVSLVSDTASLDVASVPPGAAVFLNGIERGVTPCRVDRIPAGDATVELRRPGFAVFRRPLRLAAGQEETLSASLAPLPASLTLISIPPGAGIYVDNQFRGRTPLTLDAIAAGAYRVRAELDAHEPMFRDVQLAKGATAIEEFRLQPNTGRIELTTQPAESRVFVNGREVGVTAAKPEKTDQVSEPFLVERLAPGKHEIEITKPGYFSKTVELVVFKDRTVTRHVALDRRFIPNYEVRTATAVYRGVLVVVDPQGNVKLEIRPGAMKTIRAEDIRERKPLRVEDPK